ncbi:MAG TPA: TetR family transcriptional regulator [Pseudonocardia sp.]|jgi:AcrR family transcriptional regulator
MRADAARNLDAVLQTGARLLAEDPSTSMGVIAVQAGVDRRTVYRRFECREALLDAVFCAKLTALDKVYADARLDSAPVAVALHRFVEGVIEVVRRYPLDTERMRGDAGAYGRVLQHGEQLEAFMRRAADEGLIRSDLPDGMAVALLKQTIALLARKFGEIERGRAADIAVDILLGGIGQNV